MDSGQQLVALGVQLLDLVRNGSRTTTYKPATLLALIDVLAVHADAAGRVPDEIPLEALGARVVALYWPQVREYDGLDRTGVVLRQISDRQKGSVILREVRALYEDARERGIRSPAQAALLMPAEHRAAVRLVARNLSRYPLARLQRPGEYREGQPYDRPLYDDTVFGSERQGIGVLQLHQGVGERLLALSALLTPVLQHEWAQQVASLNALPSEDLHGHLFGRERSDLGRVREALRDLQQGCCLYCGAPLRGQGQVDHVVPWSLHPQDAIENLVLAHDRCNGSKSAYLLDLGPCRRGRSGTSPRCRARLPRWTGSAMPARSSARPGRRTPTRPARSCGRRQERGWRTRMSSGRSSCPCCRPPRSSTGLR